MMQEQARLLAPDASALGEGIAVDAVTAADADEAEAKFVARALADRPVALPTTPTRGFARPDDDAVFGLFPQAEGRG